MLNRVLVVTLSRGNVEIERGRATTGPDAVKAALLMLAKRDALGPGDVLRVEADD